MGGAVVRANMMWVCVCVWCHRENLVSPLENLSMDQIPNDCCVCYQEVPPGKALCCPVSAQHRVCLDCSKKLIYPSVCKNSNSNKMMCAGLHAKCPLCREEQCVSGEALLSLVAGGRDQAMQLFQCHNKRVACEKWQSELKRRRVAKIMRVAAR